MHIMLDLWIVHLELIWNHEFDFNLGHLKLDMKIGI